MHYERAAIRFYLEPARQQSTDWQWSHHWLSSTGEQMLSYCKDSTYHWLRFPGLADFKITFGEKELTCYPATETSHQTIRHLFLDQVLPRYLAHQGRLMVHASAIQLGRGVIVFLGDSGTGKSTLAGKFHQTGQAVLSDDCLQIKDGKTGIKAIPTYAGIRLWEDSLDVLFPHETKTETIAYYSSKKRVLLDQNDRFRYRKGLHILAIFVLIQLEKATDGDVRLERLSYRDAFIALMKQSFQLDVMDSKGIKRHMRELGRIVPRLPVYQLSMPHDYDLLPLVRQKIMDAVDDLKNV